MPARPSFVGRTADRDRLAAVLGRLRTGLSAALVLSGDPGIGKTWNGECSTAAGLAGAVGAPR